MPGNFFCRIALFLWVPLTLYAFATRRLNSAVAWSLFCGALFLPERIEFDFPLVPAFGKHEVAAFWALVGVLIWHRERLRIGTIFRGGGSFAGLYLLSAFATAASNGDGLQYGPTYIGGLSLYDGVSMALGMFLETIIPFHLARVAFRSEADLLVLARTFLGFALVYTLGALIEVRLSPQLHNWIYGFMPTSFIMTLRGGGYRPMLFMEHGLAVAQLFLSAMVVAFAFQRAKIDYWQLGRKALAGWFVVILVVCKSTGALLTGLTVLPALLRARALTIARISALLASLVFVYPALRLAHLVPIEYLVAKAYEISDERGQSLFVRLYNEEDLSAKAAERVWFGWGGYGRNRVFDAAGRDTSTTDSWWALVFGVHGIAGFVGFFGLLVWPVVAALRRVGRIRNARTAELLASLALVGSLNTFDLLLNGLFSYLPAFYSGCLLGLVEGIRDVPARRRRPLEPRVNLSQPPPEPLAVAVGGENSAGAAIGPAR